MKSKAFTVSLPKNPSINMNVIPGHFTTSHFHISHYLDLDDLKTNSSLARDVAVELALPYLASTLVDTIVCMEGTEVIGAYMAEEYLANSSDKKIYYVNDEKQQAQYIRMFKENSMDAVILNTMIDTHFISFMESENKDVKFLRVDSDIIENMKDSSSTDDENKILQEKLEKILKEATGAEKLKLKVEDAGFSGPTMANDIRVCVVIEDAQFNETLSSIAQRSKYLEILYPVLLALVCILGLITGFLAVNSRREDIALMRGMGTHKRRIFATIFGEQLLLLLFGVLPAAGAWYAREGAAQLITPGVYAFFICYALSVALSTWLQNAKNALSILSEKE